MSLEHSCGIFGVYGHDDAVAQTCWGLQSLQHRGQEGAGIASTGGDDVKLHAGRGLVADVFSDPTILEALANPVAM
ncbi:MAG TPA: amidophosphoribosyltransferase, partial [Planctomycetes bacterium]|nr:amidophosphoribosyltransferase [Planctomycetota bacterium]